MFGRHLWSPVRGLALFAMGVASVFQLIVIVVGALAGSLNSATQE